MKKILFSTVLSGVAVLALNAAAENLPSHGLVDLKWTVYQEGANTQKYAGNGKTNISGAANNKSTNVVQVYSSTAKSFGALNTFFLELITNSLKNASLAKGQLATDGYEGIYIVDKTGTNVITNLSSIITLNVNGYSYGGSENYSQTSTKSGTSSTDTASYSESGFIVLSYDDSGLKTSDGTTSTFSFYGAGPSSYKYNEAETTKGVFTGSTTGSFTYTGVGQGTIRGTPSTFTGAVGGSYTGPAGD